MWVLGQPGGRGFISLTAADARSRIASGCLRVMSGSIFYLGRLSKRRTPHGPAARRGGLGKLAIGLTRIPLVLTRANPGTSRSMVVVDPEEGEEGNEGWFAPLFGPRFGHVSYK